MNCLTESWLKMFPFWPAHKVVCALTGQSSLFHRASSLAYLTEINQNSFSLMKMSHLIVFRLFVFGSKMVFNFWIYFLFTLQNARFLMTTTMTWSQLDITAHWTDLLSYIRAAARKTTTRNNKPHIPMIRVPTGTLSGRKLEYAISLP